MLTPRKATRPPAPARIRPRLIPLGAGFIVGFMALLKVCSAKAELAPLGYTLAYAANYAFCTKMVALCVAVGFQFLIYRKVIRSGAAESGSPRNIMVACCSLTSWFLVGWAGRAIAFLG